MEGNAALLCPERALDVSERMEDALMRQIKTVTEGGGETE
jgi:hypothetical protein